MQLDFHIRNYFADKTIGIVGANGYIGNALTIRLSDFGCKILKFSRNIKHTEGSKKTSELISNIYLDINNNDYWDDIIGQIDILFYFGAQTSIYKANNEPYENYLENVLPFLNLLESAKIANRKLTIVFSSTATVFGLTTDFPVSEAICPKPITIYDIHKLLAEKYLEMYCLSGFVNGFSLRLPNIYGYGYSLNQAPDRGILTKIAKMALTEKHINIYGKGEGIRDYLHVSDLIEAFILGTVNIDKVNGNSFCIGSGKGVTVKDAFSMVAHIVGNTIGSSIQINYKEMPYNSHQIEERSYMADYSLFGSLVRWNPKINFEEGVCDLVSKIYHELTEGKNE